MGNQIKSNCCAKLGSKQKNVSRLSNRFFWLYPLFLIAVGYAVDLLPMFLLPSWHHAPVYWGCIGLLTAFLMVMHAEDVPFHRGVAGFLLLGAALFGGLEVIGLIGFWHGLVLCAGLSVLAQLLVLSYLRLSLHSWKDLLSHFNGMVLGVCVVAAFGFLAESGYWFFQALAVVGSLGVGGVFAYTFASKRENKANIWGGAGLQHAVSLAVWSSFLFSFWQLALALRGVSQAGCFFFCDCWKTLGMVLLARSCMGEMEKGLLREGRLLLTDVLSKGEEMLWRWMQWVPMGVQLSALACASYWYLALGGQGLFIPCQVFATVCISACPCVAVLAVPLALWRVARDSSKKGVASNDFSRWVEKAVGENVGLVKAYYVASVLLSGGGFYVLTGSWLSPWHAGLGMLMGQFALLGNSSRPIYDLKINFALKSFASVDKASRLEERVKKYVSPLAENKTCSQSLRRSCCKKST